MNFDLADTRQNCAKCNKKFGLTGIAERYYIVCPECEKHKCETCKDTGYYGDNSFGIRGNKEYQRCDVCDFWSTKITRYSVYPPLDNQKEKILYFAEFYPQYVKVYKRDLFPKEMKQEIFGILMEEGHSYVLFEFPLGASEPTEETVEFMVDSMNEKYNRDKL